MLSDPGSSKLISLFIDLLTIAFKYLKTFSSSSKIPNGAQSPQPHGLRPILFSVYASPVLLPALAQDSIWGELGLPSPAGLSPASSVTLLGALKFEFYLHMIKIQRYDKDDHDPRIRVS